MCKVIFDTIFDCEKRVSQEAHVLLIILELARKQLQIPGFNVSPHPCLIASELLVWDLCAIKQCFSTTVPQYSIGS